MQLLILFLLTVGPWGIAISMGNDGLVAARAGIALVFFYAGMGHFLMTEAMARMLPPQIPKRRKITQVSGFFEILLGLAALIVPDPSIAGIVIILFFVAVFPINVYASIKRVPFGGHQAGPAYLLLRAPLQLLFIAWTWWFFIIQTPPS